MCECKGDFSSRTYQEWLMGKLPYQIQTSGDPNVIVEQDVAGDIVLIDSVSGIPVDVIPTPASETTRQSNWLPILIITGITLFALKGTR